MIEKILIIIIPVTHGLSGAALFLKTLTARMTLSLTLSDLLFRVHKKIYLNVCD